MRREGTQECLELEEARRLDEQLAALGRGEGGLRLRIGDLAEALGKRAWHMELGFSSIGDYAVQRCERKGRWLGECRSVARTLASLPLMREALRKGDISWSMAVLCAPKTPPEREAEVLGVARESTVRQMRAHFGRIADENPRTGGRSIRPEPDSRHDDDRGVLGRCEAQVACVSDGIAAGEAAVRTDDPTVPGCATAEPDEAATAYDRLRRRSLQRSVPEALVQRFEATRFLIDHLEGGASLDTMVEAMLIETETKLMAKTDVTEVHQRIDRWEGERRAWLLEKAASDEALEAKCEANLAAPAKPDIRLEDAPIPGTPETIDAEIVELCTDLSRRDLSMGKLAERLCALNGWRRLGYASVAQYARERIGVSASTLEHKMTLARRAHEFPVLAAALERGSLGAEAVQRIGRVASPETVEAWVDRAEVRTIKHLDEEVRAVRMLARLGGPSDPGPPDDRTLEAAFEIERMVLRGQLLVDPAEGAAPEAPQISEAESCGGCNANEEGSNRSSAGRGSASKAPDISQMSAPRGGAAIESSTTLRDASVTEAPSDESPVGLDPRLVAALGADARQKLAACDSWALRLTLSEPIYERWIALENAYRRVRETDKSFVEFMLDSVWEVWGPRFKRTRAYEHIYVRDRCRCSNPVCSRRTLGPHHLVYRSQGGTDDDENLTTLCPVCHLHGVHEGRIRVSPPASNMRWVLGRNATLIVRGRSKDTSPRDFARAA